MLNKEDCFILGVVTGPVKDEGEISILIDADDPGKYGDLDFLLIEVNNELVPFEVLEISLRSNSAHVRLSGVDNADQASVLKGASVFLPMESLPKLSGKEFYLFEIEGFDLIDSIKGKIGVIKDVFDLPHHTVASLEMDGKEVLIPLRKELIRKIDRTAGSITMDLPEGLIDIYLG